MTYSDLIAQLFQAQYYRVEKDDRLKDVFPRETREWGVELWERWGTDEVDLVRVRLPFNPENLSKYQIPRHQLEKLLLENQKSDLSDFTQLDFT